MFQLFVTLSALILSSDAAMQYPKLERKTEFNDLVDTTSIIKSSIAYSVIACSRKCGETDGCVAFYFVPSTKQCQEHSLRSNKYTADFFTHAEGSMYYQLPVDVPATFNCPVNGSWVINQLHDGSMAQYLLDLSDVNQSIADGYCRERGAYLVKLASAEKVKFYTSNFFPCAAFTRIWVDGTNNPTNLDYVTHDGDVIPLGTDIWRPYDPDNESTLHCIMSRMSDDLKLNTANCNFASKQIMCEKWIVP